MLKGMDFFGLIVKDLYARRIRYGFALFAVGVALMGAITLIGFSESIKQTVESGLSAGQVDLLALQARKIDPITSRLPQKSIQEIRNIPGVLSAEGYLNDMITLGNGQAAIVFGLAADNKKLQYSDQSRQKALQPEEVLVGWALAKLAAIRQGDILEINFRNYRVVGNYRTNNLIHDGGIYMRLDDMQKLLNIRDQISFIFVYLEKKGLDTDTIVRSIESISPGIRALSFSQLLGESQYLIFFRSLSQIVLLTSVLLAILIISMIMLMAVNERIKDIAIKRAVGWSRYRIAALILTETGIITFCGTLLGLLLGWAGLSFVIDSLRQDVGFFIESSLAFRHFIWIGFGGIAIGLVGSTIPIYYATQVHVSKALKYE